MSTVRRSGVNVISLLAAACAALASSSFSSANARQAPVLSSGTLREIVVTAETYASSTQATPISLTAITGAQLANRGIDSIETLARDVPGLSLRSAGPGQTEFEGRGIASNGGNSPTVGFYIGDIPILPPAMGQIGKLKSNHYYASHRRRDGVRTSQI